VGGFFLFKRSDLKAYAAACTLFEKRGFQNPPVEFKTAEWHLLLWQKQLLEVPNWVEVKNNIHVCSVGTPIYRGLSFPDGLEELATDIVKNEIDFTALQGAFVIILQESNKFRILMDELAVGPVFIDEEYSRLSSSFLALLHSSDQRRALNQMALREKLTTGIILGPDTLVEGIVKATHDIQAGWKGNGVEFVVPTPRGSNFSFVSHGFNRAVQEQVDFLQLRIRSLKAFSDLYGIDLGLSGGYDSRLLFALCANFSVQIDPHTHATRGVHEAEKNIATKLSQIAGNPIRFVITKQMKEHDSESFERVLDDCLFYFDGRSSAEIGSYSETSTRGYQAQLARGYGFRLSGLGGEIYRNHYGTTRSSVSFFPWSKRHIYYPGLGPDAANSELHRYIVNKLEARLKISLKDRCDFFALRRYYGEARLSESNGCVINAHNQLTFYATPFNEYRVILKAYEATPYIRLSGDFQAAMIRNLNPELSSVQSSYGYSFENVPLYVRAKELSKGMIPDAYWLRYYEKRLSMGWRSELEESYWDMVRKHPVMNQAHEALRVAAPWLEWQFALRDIRSIRTIVYLGYFFRTFAHLLKL
jgi:hypothetical protein